MELSEGLMEACSLSAECILTGVLQGSGISEEKQVTSCARKTSSSCRAGT